MSIIALYSHMSITGGLLRIHEGALYKGLRLWFFSVVFKNKHFIVTKQ